MDNRLADMAARIRGVRDDLGIATAEMAEVLGITEQDYLAHERGERDFSFTFLYNAAHRFGMDITELLTGVSPKLDGYTVVRKGRGLRMERRQGFSYQNLAHLFRNRIAEPFIVEAPYDPVAEAAPILLNSHAGQEFDYVLEGQLRMRIGEHEFTLGAGDSVYYDSSVGHGMVAAGGEGCRFMAVVMKECDGGTAK